jgi:type IX secretion system PorP/SprF family membrane protein
MTDKHTMKHLYIKILLIATCLLLITPRQLFSQNYITQEHGYLTDFIFNPSVAGIFDAPRALISVKKNWIGIKESPTTCMFNAYSNLGQLKLSANKKYLKRASNVGLGLGFCNDKNGPLTTTGFQITYSYHAKIKDKLKLAFGLSTKFMFYTINNEKLIYNDPDDPMVNTQNDTRFVPNFNFGMTLYGPAFHVGLSCTNLADFNGLNKKFYYKEDIRVLYLYGEYIFTIGSSTLTPLALVRYHSTELFFDTGLKYEYNNLFNLYLGYGSPDFILFRFGYKIKSFTIGYGFELSWAPLYKYSGGNHMMYLGYNM